MLISVLVLGLVGTLTANGYLVPSKPIIKTTKRVGSERGSYWSDEDAFLSNGAITSMQIASGDVINGFRVKYGRRWGRWHGGTGGNVTTIAVRDITLVKGHQSTYDRVLSLEFETSNGERYGPYGESKQKHKEYYRSKDITGHKCRLAFMSGYTNAVDWLLKVTGITFHWDCGMTKPKQYAIKTTPPIGREARNFWSDENVFLKHGAITGMQLTSGNIVNGFRVKYGRFWGRWHGGTGGKFSSLDITNIISVSGLEVVKDKVVSIEFTTGTISYGPFGGSTQGTSYVRQSTGCTLAFMSGYTGAVGWLFRVTGITFHWMCEI